MNKQWLTAVMAAMTGLMAATTWAARETLNFEVSVTVPSRPFYIIPSEPNWIHRPQHLVWNYSDSTLSRLSRHFDVRHDTSAIEARLETPPHLATGRPGEIIGLRVRFNGVELSDQPAFRQVLSQEEAAAGRRVLLEVDPIIPVGGYRPGEYSGNLLMLFNARAPGQ
ncbi:CS1 type fimbrial major subunit [Pseudomonas sp. B2M1-30]|uniref:CS1 type fimbrial major subunit n=1 Tax=Pseudomonas koreensis TaxID=198620 RepID=A0A9X2XST9_9PSED|nr:MULTISPECIES: CS1 type fimbrial major subunit [Pseudomonas]MCU0118639.1 CS1 type fimbrial major subunit [Pseudomonas sp. B2M1-30]MCU7251819.1 CS1 type fimbrial major subunit [Pseudomonas koreensis]MCU7263093.1 CS1 type fimbrial major subunit [Pseudomonas koreensis]